jgi:putative heme-binding domain-containing protein
METLIQDQRMKPMLNHLYRLLPAILVWLVPLTHSEAEVLEIKAFSIGYGQWVAYSEKSISNEQLKPFIGQYLLAGKWPRGVYRPDDAGVLLGREKMAAVRIVSIQAEKEGRMILLTTDPAVTPDEYRRTIGELTLSASFQGISANLINNAVQGKTKNIVIPFPTGMEKLKELSRTDSYLASFLQNWINPDSEIRMQFWTKLPEGLHELIIRSGREFQLESNGEQTQSVMNEGNHQVELKLESAGIEQEIKLAFTGGSKKVTETSFLELTSKLQTDGKQIDVVLTSWNYLVPWAPEPLPEATVAIAPPPYELIGGNAIRGREIFYSQTAKCANCHAIQGVGGKIGPDLTELKGKDPTLIFHHINAPSDRIHPGYPSFTLALTNGQVAMGVVKSLSGNEFEVLDTDARSLKFQADEVEELKPSTSSIMPQGLAGSLGEASVRDLIAFLTGDRKESQ